MGYLGLPQATSGYLRLPQAATGYLRLPQATLGYLRPAGLGHTYTDTQTGKNSGKIIKWCHLHSDHFPNTQSAQHERA
ncbi:hypothetical protein PoB_001323100 [Plakobranchus ocellatus]|uniref:Uncharacterized protein n=1 Tax=Plakobranchus ocellatus TaxID=259542 RepID=A0AAV3YWH5_9GAST|nr:hypothetical protein PoB_001323100 [Plakobranchus ocellatus]